MSHSVNTLSLRETKINRPSLSIDLVERPRLLKQLQSPSNLVLVVAPAGYGKTTLIASWLDHFRMPSVWFSIDESDNDFSTFVNYLVAAIHAQFPGLAERTSALLLTATKPSVKSVCNSLVNELSSLEKDFILVLDDYHLIRNRLIHELLTELLRHPLPSLHLVMAARHDPALPLPMLRARGLMTEIRAADLSFTLEETARFFRDGQKMEITDQDIALLRTRTEGWPVSLRLAAIHFKQSSAHGLVEDNEHGGNRMLVDYLVNEVSSNLPMDVQGFLMRTSILDQVCGPLCDALVGSGKKTGEGQRHLDWLVKSAFFTTPVDSVKGWYRYHHLLRQYLLAELKRNLSAKEISKLHLRASKWFESRGVLDNAILHAFDTGDSQAAVEIFIRHRLDLQNADDNLGLERLLSLFPRQLIEKHLELKLAEVMVLFFKAQLARVAEELNEIESSLPKARLSRTDRDRLEGEVATWRSVLSYWEGDISRCGSLARLALKKLPADSWFLRFRNELFLSNYYLNQRGLSKAMSLYENNKRMESSPQVRSYQKITPCFLSWQAADLNGLNDFAHQIIELNKQISRKSEDYSWACYFAGIVQYHRNNLEKTEEFLSPIILHPEGVHANCYINSAIALALIYHYQGHKEKARQLSEMLFAFAQDTTSHQGLKEASAALMADLALQDGDVRKAGRWADSYKLIEQTPVPYFYASFIVYIRTLLAQDSPASLRKAAKALSKLKEHYTENHQTRWLISVLSLNAMLWQAKGNEKKALAELERAIRLAEPGGFIRLFIDLGEPMKSLLVKLQKKEMAPVYLERILTASEMEEAKREAGRMSRTGAKRDLQPSLGVTSREMDVLTLLDKRFTDKEIAETLFISKETVHTHIAHLADKLNARGRREIVREARQLGLLP